MWNKNLENNVHNVLVLHWNVKHTNSEKEEMGRVENENLQVSVRFYLFKKNPKFLKNHAFLEHDIFTKC